MKQDQYDSMFEEINSARNATEKDMLLQKFGMIDPKLTEYEKSVVFFEGNPVGWEQSNFLGLSKPWEAA